jgi:hypothetical protein
VERIVLSTVSPPIAMIRKLTPQEKEARSLHHRGKAPDVIAVRLGMKMSKVIAAINYVEDSAKKAG